jgi:hypothetical protein
MDHFWLQTRSWPHAEHSAFLSLLKSHASRSQGPGAVASGNHVRQQRTANVIPCVLSATLP